MHVYSHKCSTHALKLTMQVISQIASVAILENIFKNNGKELNNNRMYMYICMPNIYLHNKIDMGRSLLKRNDILMCISLPSELCRQLALQLSKYLEHLINSAIAAVTQEIYLTVVQAHNIFMFQILQYNENLRTGIFQI